MPVLGYFIFQPMGDGCLGSKFGHTRSVRIYTESATPSILNHGTDPFIGEYLVSWIDSVSQPESVLARLVIERKAGSLVGQYELIWSEVNDSSQILYYGEGMVFNGVLSGSYWNHIINNTQDLRLLLDMR